jgi:hypothetical protein
VQACTALSNELISDLKISFLLSTNKYESYH